MRWKACRVEFGRENECTGHSYSLKPQPAHFDSVETPLCCFTLLTSLCRPLRLSQCPQRAPLLSTPDEPSIWSDGAPCSTPYSFYSHSCLSTLLLLFLLVQPLCFSSHGLRQETPPLSQTHYPVSKSYHSLLLHSRSGLLLYGG